ncbi:MAG: peptidoglycan editing factor PgeF [Microgenomates group bacterium]
MITYDPFLKIFYSTKINDNHYISGFGTRALGDARHIDNIFNFFNQAGIYYKTIVAPEQIHSVNIAVISEEVNINLKKVEEVDGLITKNSNTVLTIKTADCLPIIYVDKKNELIGISHQGWRGSLKKMTQKMVIKMLELGSKLEDILIVFGPSIGNCCYNIDEDRYYSFLEEFDGYSDKIFHRQGGRRYLNLPLLNYLLLVDVGIPKKNIDFFPFCTKCDRQRFFSFRRDKDKEYGEMLSFILKK